MIGIALHPLRLLDRLREWSRREDGTATLDFVILVPVFVSLFVSSFEVSIFTIRQMMLDRALDLVVRDLRLGTWTNVTSDTLKAQICERTIGLLPDCSNQLMIEMVPISSATWDTPDPNATCVDRDAEVQPAVAFNPGTENQMVIIRACSMVDPFFPGTGLALSLEANVGDGFPIIATSGFVNEPGTGT